MIKVYGTSHVSTDSFEVVDKAFEEIDPDVVALELDPYRLESLLNDGETGKASSLFLRLLQWVQKRIGEKTGVMPGSEMVYGYEKALENDKEVFLIDQDVRITFRRLMAVRRREKVKAGAGLLGGFLLPGKTDLSRIPSDHKIEEMLQIFRDRFPGLYNALVKERNDVMIEAVKRFQEENPEKDIAVFIGAAHKKALKKELEGLNTG